MVSGQRRLAGTQQLDRLWLAVAPSKVPKSADEDKVKVICLLHLF